MRTSGLNIKLKGLRRPPGSSCYILGNGPSLKPHLVNDAGFLKSRELFVVNEFAKSEHYESLMPRYYVIADPSYWDTRIHEYFFYLGTIVREAIRDKTTWPMYLIVPTEAYKNKPFMDFFAVNRNITLINYNKTSVKGFKGLSHWLYRNYLGMPTVQNVLVASIGITINMGYSEINVLGADHSWTRNMLVNMNNEVCQADDHFYDSEKKYVPFIHAFGNPYKMHTILRDFAQMFESYHLLRSYANEAGSTIYNRCEASFIDAFERKPANLDEADGELVQKSALSS